MVISAVRDYHSNLMLIDNLSKLKFKGDIVIICNPNTIHLYQAMQQVTAYSLYQDGANTLLK